MKGFEVALLTKIRELSSRNTRLIEVEFRIWFKFNEAKWKYKLTLYSSWFLQLSESNFVCLFWGGADFSLSSKAKGISYFSCFLREVCHSLMKIKQNRECCLIYTFDINFRTKFLQHFYSLLRTRQFVNPHKQSVAELRLFCLHHTNATGAIHFLVVRWCLIGCSS